MLEILADPVAQARFFDLLMQLFFEHVLGIMPFDQELRAQRLQQQSPFARWQCCDIAKGSRSEDPSATLSHRGTSSVVYAPAHGVAFCHS